MLTVLILRGLGILPSILIPLSTLGILSGEEPAWTVVPTRRVAYIHRAAERVFSEGGHLINPVHGNWTTK